MNMALCSSHEDWMNDWKELEETKKKIDFFNELDKTATAEQRFANYRGKFLGFEITEEQWKNIRNGSFKGMFRGDYWVLNGRRYTIDRFDQVYEKRNKTPHHITIIPEEYFYEKTENTKTS